MPNTAEISADPSATGTTGAGSAFWEPGYLHLDPGVQANAEVQFTAPTAGSYLIQGSFDGEDSSEQSHAVQILDNGIVVFNQTVSGTGTFSHVSFNLTETLNAGDTIDFVDYTSGFFYGAGVGLADTITAPGSPPPSSLFTTGSDTVDFTGLTSAQVQAINAGAQFYNALGGSDTVTLPSSPDGKTYELVPQSGAGAIASGIVWNPNATFAVGSTSDTSATIDSITAGDPGTPTLGSYQIQINGQATATVTINDYVGTDQDIINAINNFITLGTGNDTINLNGNGNSTVSAINSQSGLYTININGITGHDSLIAGPGKGILNISEGAYLAVSSTFFGSATIGANSTLEFQGAATGPGNTIAFTEDNPHTGSNATLQIDGTTMPTQTITGFLLRDTITLSGLPAPLAATVLKAGNVLAVFTTDGTEYDLKLDPNQTFSGGFQISGPAGGPQTITLLANYSPAGSTAPVTGYATNIYPYNCICYIRVPTGPDTYTSGTGFIIGPHTILTAAHLVAGVPTDNYINSSQTLEVSSPTISVTGRYHISSEPWSGVLGPSTAQTDFAIITVAQDLKQTGFILSPPAFSTRGTVNVTGYPNSVPGYSFVGNPQFNDIGTVSKDSQYADLDWVSTDPNSLVAFPGESGAPLWTMSGSTATAVGISSTDGSSAFTTTGFG